MIKKLLSFYFLLFISFISFSQEAYYNDVDKTLTGLALKNALTTKITATHTNKLTYTPGVWEASRVTDENPSNTSEVILIYGWTSTGTTARTINKNFQDGSSSNSLLWNREHVYSKSLANPKFVTDQPGPGTDAHNLRPANSQRNSTRSNFKFGSGSGNSGFSSVTYSGPNGPNTAAWFPGDEWKGDVARMMMYMYVRYGAQCLPTGVGVGSKEFTPDDMIDLFLQWNVEDPVSAIEIARNNYHENTANSAAQGNRNPFIDNPYLATRIWGGNSAEDRWDYYVSTDTQAPTVPADVSLSNISLNSMDISWTASTDNIGVTGYNIYIDGILEAQTTNTTYSFSDLETNTTYSFTVVAKDLINNMSAASIALDGTTLGDTVAPTTPADIMVSNETDSSFNLTWTASTDNNAVGGYEIYVDNNLTATTTNSSYTIVGLNASTSYSVEILAFDNDNNKSNKSASVNATTTAGVNTGVTELFISEYVEPSAGNNKAIEIVNLTGSTINLADYSIQKQSNGGSWVDDYDLGNSNIIPGDVFVIVHVDTQDSHLLAESDLFGPPNIDTSPFGYGSPMNFNGNDPIGLYKNGVLIDVIGEEGNSSDHIKDKTYRRKATITGPNTRYDSSEWDILAPNTFDGIGSHTSTLSSTDVLLSEFNIYPNPTNGDEIFFTNSQDLKVTVFNSIGKEVISTQKLENNKLDISKLSKGIYLIKVNSGDQQTTKKLIRI